MDWISGYRLPSGSELEGGMSSPVPGSTPSPLMGVWPNVKQEGGSPNPISHTTISTPGSIKGI